MGEITPIKIPLVNPNEPESLLAALHIREGQQVAVGDLICTLETTKSTAEMQAEESGFVIGLRLAVGETVRAGDVLGYLADSPDAQPPQQAVPVRAPDPEFEVPEGLRITQPALTLARQNGIDLRQFSPGALVTENAIREVLQNSAHPLQARQDPTYTGPDLTPPAAPIDLTRIIIYGGGGHGKSVIELIRRLGAYQIAGIVDDGLPPGKTILNVPVLGGQAILPELSAQGIRLAANAIGGIGNVAVRIKIFQRLAEAGFAFPILIHPSAVVEESAQIEPGVHIFPMAYIGSAVRLGFGAIINTRAIVSHECKIGAYANLSPGSILAGEVQVGDGALVGMGVNVNLQVKIGRLARLGNGSIIKSDIPDNGIVRAGGVWPIT